jgi:hypothetical protein
LSLRYRLGNRIRGRMPKAPKANETPIVIRSLLEYWPDTSLKAGGKRRKLVSQLSQLMLRSAQGRKRIPCHNHNRRQKCDKTTKPCIQEFFHQVLLLQVLYHHARIRVFRHCGRFRTCVRDQVIDNPRLEAVFIRFFATEIVSYSVR